MRTRTLALALLLTSCFGIADWEDEFTPDEPTPAEPAEPAPAAGQCDVNSRRCVGADRQVCSPSGEWTLLETCRDAVACAPNRCAR